MTHTNEKPWEKLTNIEIIREYGRLQRYIATHPEENTREIASLDFLTAEMLQRML